ncbi:MAG: hypothetical protein RLZ10_1052 [Bacteroidota bacterium]|jgi:hypothetical protein
MNNKNTFRLLSGALVVISFTLMFLLYSTNREYNQLQTKSNYVIDSLHEELFIIKTENGRHEITRDEIFNKYPQAGKEYQQFYEHETE